MASSDDSPDITDSRDGDFAMMTRIAEASAVALCAEEAAVETEEATMAVRQALALADASRRLRGEVERAAVQDAFAMNALQRAVRDFTLAHRDDGLTPERVLIALKKLVDERSLPAVALPYSRKTSEVLREAVSTWSIKAYFNADGASR
jgi:hypothetical protein